MKSSQVAQVKGIWKGTYVYEGKEHPVTFYLYTNDSGTCQVDVPPVAGKETAQESRFCDGGEFHFKTYVGELSYEFQGTPVNNQIAGLLKIRRNDQQKAVLGRFLVTKQ
jgi:hypothetical protein